MLIKEEKVSHGVRTDPTVSHFQVFTHDSVATTIQKAAAALI
jgi:hypothetical protein